MHTFFLTYLPGDYIIGLIVLFLFTAFSIVAFILYLLTLQNTLKRITPQNRRMSPEQVWLTLIPLFGLIWHFFVVNNMALSIQNEFKSKDQPVENKPSFGVGLATCIFSVITALCAITFGPVIFFGMIACICWLVYWIKIGAYKKKLLMIQNILTPANQQGTSDKYFTS